ncbi:hypothetical protein ACC687_40450, partial [Rhizobium ruizarguesonis]
FGFVAVPCHPVVGTELVEDERMASIIIELYRQGVRDPDHLQSMVEAARGLFETSERPTTAPGI